MLDKLIKFKDGLLTGFKTDRGRRSDKDEYEEYDEYDDEEYDEEEEDEPKEVYIPESGKRDRRTSASRSSGISKSYSRAVDMGSSINLQVIMSYPQTVEEASSICDYVKSNKAVIINLEGVKHELAQRIVDFLGGAAYALDGDMQSITNKALIIAPSNVDISGHFKEELKASGVLLSFKSSR